MKNYQIQNRDQRISYDKTLPRRFSYSQRIADNRGIFWDLSFENYKKIIVMPCYYCNNEISPPVEQGIGLDRLNSKIGYELTNVVSCCKSCNTIKNDILSPEEMIKVAELIIKLRK